MTHLLGLRLDPTATDVVATARAADAAGFSFVSLDDAFAGGGPRLDAVDLAAFLGPQTTRVGLLPTVTTTHTEPFHLATATQTIDLVSRGRAGLVVDVSLDDEAAAATGRRPAPGAVAAWAEAVDVVAAIRALWDSWDDDAVIRDAATSRYIDRERLHYVDVTVHGTDATFTVKGPSIVPRTPSGQPVVMVRLTAGRHRDDPRLALVTAAGGADLVVVEATGLEEAATDVEEAATDMDTAADRGLADTLADLRTMTSARLVVGLPAGDPADPLAPADPAALADRVARLPDVDGVEIRGAVDPTALVAALHARGIEPATGGPTFRDLLGLARPTDRYAGAATGAGARAVR